MCISVKFGPVDIVVLSHFVISINQWSGLVKLGQTTDARCYMLSLLKSNVHKCLCHVKENCFNALVRPLEEYASSVWDPHKQTQIDKFEKINTRAARFINGNRIFAHRNTEQNFSLLG